MKRISRRQLLAAAVAAGAVTVTATPSWSAAFNITVAAGHPPHFLWVKLLQDYFIPEVDERLKAGGTHSIAWTQGYGGTIAKIGGVLEAIEEGLVEMGFVGTIFEAAKMPLQNVSYVCPFGSADIGAVTGAIGALQQEIPAMGEAWKARNQRYLAGAALDTYHLWAKFPINSLDDLNGKKILAPGPAANWIKGTGAVAVAGNLQTYYNDISTGVADGVVVFTTGAWGSKVFEVAPYINKCNFGAQFAGGLSVNLDAWNGMPADVQSVLTDVRAAPRQRWKRTWSRPGPSGSPSIRHCASNGQRPFRTSHNCGRPGWRRRACRATRCSRALSTSSRRPAPMSRATGRPNSRGPTGGRWTRRADCRRQAR